MSIYREELDINNILQRYDIKNDDLTMELVRYVAEKKIDARDQLVNDFIKRLEQIRP